MITDDPIDDRQAETTAMALRGTASGETALHALKFVGIDTDPSVANRDFDAAVHRTCDDLQLARVP